MKNTRPKLHRQPVQTLPPRWPAGVMEFHCCFRLIHGSHKVETGEGLLLWNRAKVGDPWTLNEKAQICALEWTTVTENNVMKVPVGTQWEEVCVPGDAAGMANFDQIDPTIGRALRYHSVVLQPSAEPARIGGPADKKATQLVSWKQSPTWDRILIMQNDSRRSKGATPDPARVVPFVYGVKADGSQINLPIPVDPTDGREWADVVETHAREVLELLDTEEVLEIAVTQHLPAGRNKQEPIIFTVRNPAVLDAVYVGTATRLVTTFIEQDDVNPVW